MRDNRILIYIYLFVAFISAIAVIIAAFINNSKNQVSPPTNTNTPSISESLQGKLIFDENFDDSIANGITTSNTKWEIINDNNGNKLFQLDNSSGTDWIDFTLGTVSITNGAIEYKVKLVNYDVLLTNGSGAIVCHFRSNLQNRYLVALQADTNLVSINYQGVDTDNKWALLDNAVSPYIFKENIWYEVKIDLNKNEISIHLDGKNLLTADDDRLTTGEIIFGIAPNTIVQFDDIFITEFK